jgi:hypothetical protein
MYGSTLALVVVRTSQCMACTRYNANGPRGCTYGRATIALVSRHLTCPGRCQGPLGIYRRLSKLVPIPGICRRLSSLALTVTPSRRVGICKMVMYMNMNIMRLHQKQCIMFRFPAVGDLWCQPFIGQPWGEASGAKLTIPNDPWYQSKGTQRDP